MKSVLFIINPIPIHAKRFKRSVAESVFTSDRYRVEYKYTEYQFHPVDLARQAVENCVDLVVAVGGDGTFHEVAQSLIGSNVQLGLYSTSSSSAFANYFKIPASLEKALQIIVEGREKVIDTIKVHSDNLGLVHCISLIGIGISARVVHSVQYMKQKTRNYSWRKLIFGFSNKKEKPYRVKFQYFDRLIHPFEILVGNIDQYPLKLKFFRSLKVDDGVFDVMIMDGVSYFRFLLYIMKRFVGLYDLLDDKTEYFKGEHLYLNFPEKTKVQIDDEPYFFEGEVHISSNPASLKLIVPEKFQ